MKEEGRRKKEEGRRKEEGGRRKKEEAVLIHLPVNKSIPVTLKFSVRTAVKNMAVDLLWISLKLIILTIYLILFLHYYLYKC
jgi:hypothetical protein